MISSGCLLPLQACSLRLKVRLMPHTVFFLVIFLLNLCNISFFSVIFLFYVGHELVSCQVTRSLLKLYKSSSCSVVN